MKKWFFSNNGEVTGPLDLEDAKEFLSNTPNVYGWHPSFSQWKPASCISEFVGIIPATVQPPTIPKEISDKFLAKKQRLETKLTAIGDSINHSQSSLNKFEKQIEAYKSLTINLNDEVKGAIDKIDKKSTSLTRKLSQVKDAVQIAEREMAEVVDEFDKKLNSNEITMPSCNHVGQEGSNSTLTETQQTSKAKLAQEKLATPHKRVEPIKADPQEKIVPEKEKKSASKTPLYGEHEAKHKSKERVDPEAEYANKMAKESFNGMKNMMKSVFKGDSKVDKIENIQKQEVNQAKDEPLSMAERLKLAQNNQ